MALSVVVDSAADFERWEADQRAIAAGILPNRPADLQEWIQHTQAIKPGSEMPDVGLVATEVKSLVSYLATLR